MAPRWRLDEAEMDGDFFQIWSRKHGENMWKSLNMWLAIVLYIVIIGFSMFFSMVLHDSWWFRVKKAVHDLNSGRVSHARRIWADRKDGSHKVHVCECWPILIWTIHVHGSYMNWLVVWSSWFFYTATAWVAGWSKRWRHVPFGIGPMGAEISGAQDDRFCRCSSIMIVPASWCTSADLSSDYMAMSQNPVPWWTLN